MSQMGDVLQLVRFEAHRMWQRRWIGLAVAWVVAVIGAAGVWLYKDRYEATAKVYVDTQTVLKPLMAGLAFQPDIDQQVRMLARTLISRPNVEQLFNTPAVGLEKPKPGMLDREVEALKSKIRLESSGAGNLYTITYRDVDPKRARALVESLLNLFMDVGASVKQRDSTEAGKFIDEQIKIYETKLSEAESRLKDFKLRNFGVTGVGNQDYYARISALSEEVNKLRLDLSAAEQSRDALKRELSSEDPQLPAESIAANTPPPPPSELETRLDAQRRLLDDLLRRYTDNHPDVIAVRRTVAQLEVQKRQEAEAKAATKGRGTAATNPVFQQLRVSFASAEAHVASLRSQLGMQVSRLEQARSMANRIPQAEAEMAQLNRDYEVIRKNYEQLVSRREAASLGVKIDQSSSLADFRVVEPPQVSGAPVFPGSKIVALGAVLLAVLAGIGAAFLASRFHSTVDDEKSLRALVNRPVLGLVSVVKTPQWQSRRRRDALAFGGVSSLFALANVGWLAFLMLWSRG